MCLAHNMTGDELKHYRAILRSTQEDLADELGVHPMTVSRWERETVAIPAPVAKLVEMLVVQARHAKRPKRRK
jgi:transcriptional regulator with XRE-family HTH domain